MAHLSLGPLSFILICPPTLFNTLFLFSSFDYGTIFAGTPRARHAEFLTSEDFVKTDGFETIYQRLKHYEVVDNALMPPVIILTGKTWLYDR